MSEEFECTMTSGAYVVPTPEQAMRCQIALSIVAELIVAEEDGKVFDLMEWMIERASGCDTGDFLSFTPEGRFDSALPE